MGWCLELDESFREKLTMKHFLTKKKHESPLLYVKLMREYNYKVDEGFDLMGRIEKSVTWTSQSFDFSLESKENEKGNEWGNTFNWNIPEPNKDVDDFPDLDVETRFLCALYTYKYIPNLPGSVLETTTYLGRGKHFIWKPHTHRMMAKELREFVFSLLMIFHRVCSNLPKDVKYLLIEGVVEDGLEQANREDFFWQQ